MATGSYMTPIYSRSQSEVLGRSSQTSESTLRLVHTSVLFTVMVKVNLSTSGSQAIPKILTGWSSDRVFGINCL
ncbi:hypothetical protein TNCV_2676861 [Trichonephila clavipes]|nr:hypothetical protein TNCV_2676861 [Trichonephila clavipes]